MNNLSHLVSRITGKRQILGDLQKVYDHTADRRLTSIALRLAREDSARYAMRKMPKAGVVSSLDAIIDLSMGCVDRTLADRGLFLEFGVYKGYSINRIARSGKMKVHGFDSFQGLPETWRSGFESGMFELGDGELPIVEPNVELIKGWFDNTLPGFADKHPEDIAFLHIDCDLYSSTRTIFDLLGSRLVNQSIILFDEYFGYPTWEQHEFKAFQEFIEQSGSGYEYLAYNEQDEQVAVRILK